MITAPLRLIVAVVSLPVRGLVADVRGLVAVVRRLWAGAAGLPSAVQRSVSATARAVAGPLTVDVEPPPWVTGRGARDWFLRLDVVVAVVLYIVAAAVLVGASNGLTTPYPPLLLHLLAAAGTLPVAVRRHRPLLAWQIVLVAVVATSGWFTPAMVPAGSLLPQLAPPQAIAYLLCLYTVASRTTRPLAAGVWLWSLIGLVIIAYAGMWAGPQNAALWAWSIVMVSLVPLFGHNVSTRRSVQTDLELQRRQNEEEQAARAMLEERSRIARELHDVVAHNMSVIAIQAEAAPLKSPDDARALTAELTAIRATALETLSEMRRILGVLRNRDEVVDTAPAPGLDQLDALVDKVAAAGMDVRMVHSGTPVPVPPGVGVSAYRIVQESLSNALRHGPGAAVTVSLAYDARPAALRVQVRNGPPPVRPPSEDRAGARHGLVGMRERTAMLRGNLIAEPTADGGFVVEATLPLDGA
ncbi:MAG TPA: histidine kinase [Euzebyales bacterium]|nr:histidine kinase [Euzebyales bacterium]